MPTPKSFVFDGLFNYDVPVYKHAENIKHSKSKSNL